MSGSLTATITEAGISAPDYPTVLATLTDRFRAIYGSDAYLQPDSQDGQLLAVFALALHDVNSLAIAIYNSFSPVTAQGEGLSRVVKINGLARLVPSFSTVDLTVGGTLGATITNGVALDPNGGRWYLDNEVVIPAAGTAVVTATYQSARRDDSRGKHDHQDRHPDAWLADRHECQRRGGRADRLNRTPTCGAGRRFPLCCRAAPAWTVLSAHCRRVPSVTRVAAHENATGSTDALGVPAYSIALVVRVAIASLLRRPLGPRRPLACKPQARPRYL
jgi:hypothetical protein